MSCRSDHPAYTRRAFLQRGMTLASSAATVPYFVQQSAIAMTNWNAAVSSQAGVPEDRILVVVQLSGGNDGLNTVIPYSMSTYHTARPRIAVPDNEILKLGSSGIGLHPKLADLNSLFDDGQVTIVQGVGYPNPNRSHFKSMDIWHTADTAGVGRGWLGRYFDNECAGSPCTDIGVSIGQQAPLAMQGKTIQPINFEDANDFRWRAADAGKEIAAAYDEVTRAGEIDGVAPDSNQAFLMRTAMDAQLSGDRIRSAVKSPPKVQYPSNPLAVQLRTAASMIHAAMPTRVYYVSLDGFDTHAGQGASNGRHGARLQQLGSSLRAFMNDLRATGDDDRVLTMVFSEFGRRVGQNASGGTDHGTAAPMFLIGPMVRPGLIGRHPSLTDLDDGDLKFSIDFRSVYATVLSRWMGADSRAVLGRRYPIINAIRRK